MDAATLDEMARGYVEAVMFTEDPDPGPGEYWADPEILDGGLVYGRDAVEAFRDELNSDLIIADVLRHYMDARRFGHCLHYAREGHGVTFMDDADDGTLVACQEAARRLGPDDEGVQCVAFELGSLRDPYADAS